MGLRNVVGGAAKMTAGFWSEVAKLAEPERPAPRRPPEEPEVRAPAADRARETASQPEPTAAVEDDRVAPTREAERETEQAGAGDLPAALPEGVLVPIDTWTRVMDQLGNLHQAGQDLAEARERAARAETQVEFLKQQLADEKAQRRKPPPQPEPATPDATADPLPPTTTEIDLRSAPLARVASARNRVSGWLRTD